MDILVWTAVNARQRVFVAFDGFAYRCCYCVIAAKPFTHSKIKSARVKSPLTSLPCRQEACLPMTWAWEKPCSLLLYSSTFETKAGMWHGFGDAKHQFIPKCHKLTRYCEGRKLGKPFILLHTILYLCCSTAAHDSRHNYHGTKFSSSWGHATPRVIYDPRTSRGHITPEKPGLVVVPFSVLRNWQSELRSLVRFMTAP